MSQPKKVSNVILNILEHPIVLASLERTADIMVHAPEVLGYWSYDLMSRKPSPALMENGILVKPTDLDLICFLYELAGRNAVINIPTYKSMRQTKVREDQKLTSKYNRHGELLSVQANKEFWTFSIGVKDMNVIGADAVGDFRNFTLTDFNGKFYSGWRTIEFTPTINENKFITENKLWTGNKIYFEHMIHPNRWTSFFGQYYIISKIMMERLEEESAWLNEQIKIMKEEGIKFPFDEGPTSYDYGKPGEVKSIKVPAFEARVYVPELGLKGEYPVYNKDQKTLVHFYERRKEMQHVLKKLRCMTRATEYAHYKAQDRIPAWLENVKWEDGFREPGKRTDWRRMKLFQPEPGKFAVSLLTREYEKSTRVSVDYKEF
jgi:hypothetical protein